MNLNVDLKETILKWFALISYDLRSEN